MTALARRPLDGITRREINMNRLALLAMATIAMTPACAQAEDQHQVQAPEVQTSGLMTEELADAMLQQEQDDQAEQHAKHYTETEQVESKLIGGEAVDPDDAPNVFNITDGRGLCTASLVGPDTIVTAAHCTRQNGQVRFRIGRTTVNARCEISPLIGQGQDHDIAACKLDRKLNLQQFTAARQPRVGSTVTIFGFGCTARDRTGGNDGILRTGEARVTQLPSPPARFDFILDDDEVVLCPGDSGGPVLSASGRFILGVNSKVQVNRQGRILSRSFIASLGIRASRAFLADFARRNNVQVCGINLSGGRCL